MNIPPLVRAGISTKASAGFKAHKQEQTKQTTTWKSCSFVI